MSCPHTYLTRPHAIIATFAAHTFLFALQAWAAPHSIDLVRRDSSGSASKIAAPIIAALVFIVAIPMVFYRNELLAKFRRMSLPSVPLRQRPSPTGVRDLTAEEIAGTTATNQAQAASTANTNRRTGRNTRRTPSQISTRSLPAYMKEPGEQELVIIQGSQDMEDAPLTAQVVMPSVREDEDESSNSHSHSRGPSQASYVIINDDPLAQTPLLEQPNDSNESTHERQNTHTSAGSVDISDARLTSAEIPDPRGDAPPYFEVVGDVRATSGDLSRVDTADTLPLAPDTLPTSDATSPPVRRRSMFRGLIDAASRALSSPHPTSTPLPLSRPSRDTAVSSPRPSNLSNRQGSARSPLSGHRASPSQSGSVQSITSSAFGRVVSRTHSRSVTNVSAGLTSPSAISISAPLTHTAVRTDFVYPRSGPTREQLKLISSVESVSKFGVPYGPDAVAFASASLVNLHGPPPEFEEHPSTDRLPGPSVGETRARAGSALSRLSRDANTPDSRISQSSLPSSLRESIVPLESAAHESESSSSDPNPETRSPIPDHSNDNASAPEPEPEHPEDKKEPEVSTPIRTIPPRIPSPSPTVGTTSTAITVTKGTGAELGVVPEFPEGAALSNHRPALPSFATDTTVTPRNATAPSSFRMPSTPHGRMHPGSRSSSVETFRTAASKPEQGPESDRGASDTEHETDAFTDAESGAETEVETRPATPHGVHVESTVLPPPEPPALSA